MQLQIRSADEPSKCSTRTPLQKKSGDRLLTNPGMVRTILRYSDDVLPLHKRQVCFPVEGELRRFLVNSTLHRVRIPEDRPSALHQLFCVLVASVPLAQSIPCPSLCHAFPLSARFVVVWPVLTGPGEGGVEGGMRSTPEGGVSFRP